MYVYHHVSVNGADSTGSILGLSFSWQVTSNNTGSTSRSGSAFMLSYSIPTELELRLTVTTALLISSTTRLRLLVKAAPVPKFTASAWRVANSPQSVVFNGAQSTDPIGLASYGVHPCISACLLYTSPSPRD